MSGRKRLLVSFGLMFGTVVVATVTTISVLYATGHELKPLENTEEGTQTPPEEGGETTPTPETFNRK